jgi:hypothetical protein
MAGSSAGWSGAAGFAGPASTMAGSNTAASVTASAATGSIGFSAGAADVRANLAFNLRNAKGSSRMFGR